MYIVLIIVSLGLLWGGALFLTTGSVSLAAKLGMSEFFIGLTIVAVGTSMPEFFVSVLAAIGGNSSISVGNIVGSDIFNAMFILGVASLIIPIPMARSTVWRDIPVTFFVMILFTFFSFDKHWFKGEANSIGRLDGVIMVILYFAYILYMARVSKGAPVDPDAKAKKQKGFLMAIEIIGGLAALIFGADLFVHNATILAKKIGIPDAVIGLTLVAAGTSLPELATSIVASIKGKNEIAIANILGSNIANILLIIGVTSLIHPLHNMKIGIIDYLVMILSSVLLFVSAFTFKRFKLDRGNGAILVVCYIVYVWWLIKH